MAGWLSVWRHCNSFMGLNRLSRGPPLQRILIESPDRGTEWMEGGEGWRSCLKHLYSRQGVREQKCRRA